VVDLPRLERLLGWRGGGDLGRADKPDGRKQIQRSDDRSKHGRQLPLQHCAHIRAWWLRITETNSTDLSYLELNSI
jgi:hypothetical protein